MPEIFASQSSDSLLTKPVGIRSIRMFSESGRNQTTSRINREKPKSSFQDILIHLIDFN